MFRKVTFPTPRPKWPSVSAILVVTLLCAFAGNAAAQNRFVYLVEATDCAQSPPRRALTGFRMQGKKGVVTALHGVADSGRLTVTCVAGGINNVAVTLREVDFDRDLALLSSPEFDKLSAAEGLPVVSDALPAGEVTVIGYPLGVFREDIAVPLTVGRPPLKPLANLTDDSTSRSLIARGSPQPTLSILYLVGFLHPGNSGAPILDKSQRVVAVGNGGLKVFSGINWAIPLRGVAWEKATGNARLEKLRRTGSANLFSFDENPDGAQARIEAQLASLQGDLKAGFTQVLATLEKVLQDNDRIIKQNAQILRLVGAKGSAAGEAAPTPAVVTEIPASPILPPPATVAAHIPEDAPAYARALQATAERRYNDAKQLLQEAEDNKERQPARLARARGDNDYYASRFAEAAVSYRKALALSPDDAQLLNTLGICLAQTGDYAGAETYYRQAMETAERTLGPDHPRVAASANNLALLYALQRQYEKAEPLLKRTYDILIKVRGPDSRATLTALDNLAAVYEQMGLYDRAAPLLQQEIDRKTIAFGPGDPAVLASVCDLGSLYFRAGEYDKAEQSLKRALEGTRACAAVDPANLITALNNLGAFYMDRKRYDDAKILLREAMKTSEKAFGEDAPETAAAYQNLGMLLYAEGKYEDAAPFLKSALDIRRRSLGPDNPWVITATNNLAVCYCKHEKYADAEPYLAEAIAALDRQSGPKDRRIIVWLQTDAFVLRHLRREEDAKAQEQRAAQLKESLSSASSSSPP